jgi:hypothetical protein
VCNSKSDTASVAESIRTFYILSDTDNGNIFFSFASSFTSLTFDANLTHYLFRTPANTGMCSSVRASVTIAFFFFRFRNNKIAVLFSERAALPCIFPEKAQRAIFRLSRSIFFVTHIHSSCLPLLFWVKK